MTRTRLTSLDPQTEDRLSTAASWTYNAIGADYESVESLESADEETFVACIAEHIESFGELSEADLTIFRTMDRTERSRMVYAVQ